MLKFAFMTLGVGLSGNENVYFAAVVKYNDFKSALVIIKENDLYSDIVNTIIGDIKEMWNGSIDVDSFLVKANRYTKYRIMPFSITHHTENHKITLDEVAVEAKNKAIKFFKEADILVKDKNAKPEEAEPVAVVED